MRMIVKFSQAVPYRDAAFLQDLGQQVNARLAYLSSVSADTHVYQIVPLAGQSSSTLAEQLLRVPWVSRAELDAPAKAQ